MICPGIVRHNVLHAAQGTPLGIFTGSAEALWDGKSNTVHLSTPPFFESNNDIIFHSLCIFQA